MKLNIDIDREVYEEIIVPKLVTVFKGIGKAVCYIGNGIFMGALGAAIFDAVLDLNRDRIKEDAEREANKRNTYRYQK